MGGESEFFEVIMGLCLGLGLAAACGFRVFVPMLFLSIASRAGHVELASGFEWIGSIPAILAFATATGLEIAAYYVPWVDNLLDSVATPAAVVAGTVVTASCVGDVSPMLKWGLAIVGGGGVAGTVQATTVATRLLSATATAGLGNPLVSTAEAGASFFLALLAVLIPAIAAIVVLAIMFWAVQTLAGWFSKRRDADAVVVTAT